MITRAESSQNTIYQLKTAIPHLLLEPGTRGDFQNKKTRKSNWIHETQDRLANCAHLSKPAPQQIRKLCARGTPY